MLFRGILFCFFGVSVSLVSVSSGGGVNLTDFVRHRQKRSLIFSDGGTIKFVIGPTMPVNLGDPIVWRSLICTYNLHGGHYTIPTTPLYPWDKWEDTFARTMRKIPPDSKSWQHFKGDDSRLYIYTALETFMNKQHGNGRDCLLRAICENAQVDQHVGMFAELLNVVLRPGNELLDAAYNSAFAAGKSGVNCLKLYEKCPRGSNVLDHFLADLKE